MLENDKILDKLYSGMNTAAVGTTFPTYFILTSVVIGQRLIRFSISVRY
jgi:hypothetical protein